MLQLPQLSLQIYLIYVSLGINTITYVHELYIRMCKYVGILARATDCHSLVSLELKSCVFVIENVSGRQAVKI